MAWGHGSKGKWRGTEEGVEGIKRREAGVVFMALMARLKRGGVNGV